MNSNVSKNIVYCICSRIESVHDLNNLARVNHFWRNAIPKFIKTIVNKQDFYEPLLFPYLDAIEPKTNSLGHILSPFFSKPVIKIPLQIIERWDMYTKLYEESPIRFSNLCFLLVSYNLSLQKRKRNEADFENINNSLYRMIHSGRSCLFTKGILKNVLVYIKQALFIISYEQKRSKLIKLIESKERGVQKVQRRVTELKRRTKKLISYKVQEAQSLLSNKQEEVNIVKMRLERFELKLPEITTKYEALLKKYCVDEVK